MDLFDALDATWPAASARAHRGWLIRDGSGGGQRVSAARRLDPAARLGDAEAAMAALGQPALFQLLPGQEDLDALLADRGYAKRDPTVLLEADAARLALDRCDERTIFCDGPLAVMEAIWSEGGIGAARLAVMARAREPRSWIMGRLGDRPAGCCFVAVHGRIAMLHALEISPSARRNGLGARLTGAAARFGARNGAESFALAVTAANQAAIALYTGLGMRVVGQYHYRVATAGTSA